MDSAMQSDETVREQALSAGESFIVQAPAGSGKTELLIQRYLNLLGHVGEPEEIVAITFTRKAAAEMRERIVEALQGAASGRTGGDALETKRLDLARRAMENDRRHGWELVHHPARLQIQTIDALCLSLTRQLPFLSGFAAPAGILDDAWAMYQRSAVDAIRLLGGADAQWRDALQRFLLHVDNDMGRGTALLADMLAARDQWLRHLGGGAAAQDDLEAAWRGVIETDLRRVHELFPDALKEQLVGCANAAAAQLIGVTDTDFSTARAWLEEGDGFPGPNIDELGRWRFIAGLLLTQAGRWRSRVTVNQGFPPKSDAKAAMQELLAALADGDESLPASLRVVSALPDPRFDSEYTVILEALMTVLKLAVAQLQLVFEETGEVDFVEVTQRALAALGALEDPSDLALKLDYQIQHLLVDEFQDTSIAQYQLLRLLTQGWTPGDGKTLFLVGDPMQSIYRFREAEVAVFLRVWEEGLPGLPVRPLRLQSNFRSSPAVVDWVNEAFSDLFPASSDLQSGAVAYAESAPRRQARNGDGIHVHPFVDVPDAAQARYLAAMLGEALARTPDVAVLVRARTHLETLIPALREAGVPYSGMDVTALVNEPVVRDLYSLTRALIHPGDRIAWLSILRAPWCGLMLADLLVAAGGAPVSIRHGLRDPAVWDALSQDGRTRLERFTRVMEEALEHHGRLDLRQLTYRAWVGLGGPALTSETGIQHAREYFELLGGHQAGAALGDEGAFDAALQRHWAHSEAPAGAVQLMTIHRAKGLEFDEVFLPALERQVPSDDKRLLLWEEPVDGGLLLATLSARGEPDDPHYGYLRRLQSEKSANETDRLFYVACTRARNRLHLVGSLSSRDGELRPPRDDSLLRRIWPNVENRFETAPPPDRAPVQGELNLAPTGQSLRRLPLGWTPPAWPEALAVHDGAPPMAEQDVEFSWVGETARHVGILVHEVMQRIAVEGLSQWDEGRILDRLPSWRGRLAHIGVPPDELEDATRRAGEAIGNLLRDDRAVWLLDTGHNQAADEYELSAVEDGRVRRLRIDRTFVDESGVRWIVDYKTSAHEGGDIDAFLDRERERYREQLEAYASAFRKMGEGEIRLGLYFPLLKGWREWRYPN